MKKKGDGVKLKKGRMYYVKLVAEKAQKDKSSEKGGEKKD